MLAHSEYEADDLIGSALHAGARRRHRGVIVSADKDLSQLLDEHDEQWDFARGQRWGMAGVQARVTASRRTRSPIIWRWPAMRSTTFPACPASAPRPRPYCWRISAALDALLARVDEVPYLRFRGAAQAAVKLRLHREQALLCRQLATIALDAPLAGHAPPFLRVATDAAAMLAVCAKRCASAR